MCTQRTSNEEIIAFKPDLTISQQQIWKLMTGKWYGNQPSKEGGHLEWIVDRTIQGTYQICFRIYDKDGNFKEQTEVGVWGVSGPIYFTIFKGWIRKWQFKS